MDHATPGRRRRVHSVEFKTHAVRAAQQPDVSMAAVAMAHGINANLLRRWIHERAELPVDAVTGSDKPIGFIALPMPAPSGPPAPSAQPIRIELRRGATTIVLTWLPTHKNSDLGELLPHRW